MKLASLKSIVRALNDAEARYLIVGGLAVTAHGYGRATFDVDLVIQLKPENVERAMKAFTLLGYRPVAPVSPRDFADETMRQTWISEKNMTVFSLQSDRHWETPIDLFVTEPFDFDAEYRAALIGEILPGLSARFVRLETLLKMKAETGREKDREDIRQLKSLRENLDDDVR